MRSDESGIFIYRRDQYQWAIRQRNQNREDWIAIGITSLKLAETFFLCWKESWLFAVICSMNWLFFCTAAIILQSLGLSRQINTNSSASGKSIDILIATLPTVQKPGKAFKIISGLPKNATMHPMWRIIWGLGSIICISSMVATYILLSIQTRVQFYSWAGFQVLWLLLRSTYFHLTKKTEDALPHAMLPQNSACHGQQLLHLCAGISQYQVALHPRGQHCYLDDTQDPTAVAEILRITEWIADPAKNLVYPYPNEIQIVSVIGDTFLSSVSWIRGHSLSGFELYDSCLIAMKINVPEGKKLILLPGARVLSGKAIQTKSMIGTEESIIPTFEPRTWPNDGSESNGWVFWIPFGSQHWLYFTCTTRFLGMQQVKILHNHEVAQALRAGLLAISLTSVDDLREIVAHSSSIGQILMDSMEPSIANWRKEDKYLYDDHPIRASMFQ